MEEPEQALLPALGLLIWLCRLLETEMYGAISPTRSSGDSVHATAPLEGSCSAPLKSRYAKKKQNKKPPQTQLLWTADQTNCWLAKMIIYQF